MIDVSQAAHKVVNQLDGDEQEVFIDPATITIICAILSAVFSAIRLWCQWKQGQRADGTAIKEACNTRPLRIRIRLYRIVRRKFRNNLSREAKHRLVNAILDAGAQATPQELETLYARVNS